MAAEDLEAIATATDDHTTVIEEVVADRARDRQDVITFAVLVRYAHCSSDLTVGARVPPDRQRRPDSPEMEPESSVHRWHA